VDEAGGVVFRIPEDDRVAVGVCGERAMPGRSGDEGVDAFDRVGRLVDARYTRAVDRAGDGEGVGVHVQRGGEAAAGFVRTAAGSFAWVRPTEPVQGREA